MHEVDLFILFSFLKDQKKIRAGEIAKEIKDFYGYANRRGITAHLINLKKQKLLAFDEQSAAYSLPHNWKSLDYLLKVQSMCKETPCPKNWQAFEKKFGVNQGKRMTSFFLNLLPKKLRDHVVKEDITRAFKEIKDSRTSEKKKIDFANYEAESLISSMQQWLEEFNLEEHEHYENIKPRSKVAYAINEVFKVNKEELHTAFKFYDDAKLLIDSRLLIQKNKNIFEYVLDQVIEKIADNPERPFCSHCFVELLPKEEKIIDEETKREIVYRQCPKCKIMEEVIE